MQINLGKEPEPLRFRGGAGACLTPELLRSILIADGWQYIGNTGFETKVDNYLKRGIVFRFIPLGMFGSQHKHFCTSIINISIKGTK